MCPSLAQASQQANWLSPANIAGRPRLHAMACLARLREDYDRRPPVVSDAARRRALDRQALRLQTRTVRAAPESEGLCAVPEPETSGAKWLSSLSLT